MPRINRRSFLRASGGAAGGLLIAQHGAPVFAADAPLQPSTIVSSSEGKLRGVVIDGVSAFRGIRYGASTAGAAASCRR